MGYKALKMPKECLEVNYKIHKEPKRKKGSVDMCKKS